jgi:hypothetical protein
MGMSVEGSGVEELWRGWGSKTIWVFEKAGKWLIRFDAFWNKVFRSQVLILQP